MPRQYRADANFRWSATARSKQIARKQLRFVMADTIYDKQKPPKEETECENNWAVSVEIGKSWNSVPRFDNQFQHTQTNGSQVTGAVEISRILVPWFQLGIRASYIVLSYQDDIAYPGIHAGNLQYSLAG